MNSKNELTVFVFEYRAGAIKTGNTALRMPMEFVKLRKFKVTLDAVVFIGFTGCQKILTNKNLGVLMRLSMTSDHTVSVLPAIPVD